MYVCMYVCVCVYVCMEFVPCPKVYEEVCFEKLERTRNSMSIIAFDCLKKHFVICNVRQNPQLLKCKC